jgi:glutamine synthetase
MSTSNAIESIRASESKWVDLQFFGWDGMMRHAMVPAASADERLFTDGLPVEAWGRAISLVPDDLTFSRVPWEPNTCRFISGAFSGGEKSPLDPRHAIERGAINAKALGASEVKIAAEAEFYLFDSANVESSGRAPSYLVETHEGEWNPTPFVGKQPGEYLGQPQDTLNTARSQMADLLTDYFKYTVESHSHAKSQNGQQRMGFGMMGLTEAADAVSTLKYVARCIAAAAGNVATFMPLPIFGDMGSTQSVSFSLQKAGNNIFYDEKDKDAQISQSGLYFIGGLLEHAAALSVFAMPTTNSYKKAIADPKAAGFALEGNALVKVRPGAGYGDTRITYCGADSSACPYLAYSTILAAGLDGLKNKSDAGKMLARDEKPKKRGLPTSVPDALSALDSDNKFLKGYITPELMEAHVKALLGEHKESEGRPNAYEIAKYFNR